MDPAQPSAASDTSRSERRRQVIIRAAAEVFARHGDPGATTDEVAARASVSKQTVYKQFQDKEHLFAAVIVEMTAEVVGRGRQRRQHARRRAGRAQGPAKPRRRLAARHAAAGRAEVAPAVIAEADRFPEVGRAWFDRGFDRALVILGESLQRLADRGLLQGLGDATLAAGQFAGLVLYRPMNQAMFAGTDAVPPAETLGRIADAAVDVFLAAYG